MRFIGSLIKYFIYLSVILIAASAALFWFDTGSWLVRPLAERAGSFFLHPMRLEIQSVNGSVRNGYSINGLKLVSGDEDLFVLNHFDASPDWDLILSGMNGLPFIKSLNINGVSSDLDKVMKIAAHFSSSEEQTESPSSDFDLRLNPSNISITDVHFGTPYANLELDALTLNEAGKFLFDANLVSRDKSLPLKADANLNLSPLEVISSNIIIGRKGTGKFLGRIQPLNVKLFMTALSLEEFAAFAPLDANSAGKINGRIDGKIFAEDRNGNITASGIVSMPRANVMDIPLSFRLPFTWNGVNIFTLNDVSFTTKAASFNLSISGDIDRMRFTAKGEGKNISLTEIGTIAAPDMKLKGEGGHVKFDVDTEVTDNVMQMLLQHTRALVAAEIPSVSAMGVKAAENITANVNLKPNNPPKIAMGGRAFGGKIFARGEAEQDAQGSIRPKGVVMSIVGLDVPTLVNTFPEIAKSIGKTFGKVTATARVSDTLNVTGKLTSDKLSAYGVTLTGINADMIYDVDTNRAELKEFRANLGKGALRARANADIGSGNFRAEADADNLELRNIPQLKQLSGLYSLKADASGNFNFINTIRAEGVLTAKNAGYTGIKIGNAQIPVSFRNNILVVQDASAQLPNGSANLNATVNINDSTFRADADVQNLEMKFIPGMSGVSGKYSVTADASGKFTDISTITADAQITARNAGYSGMSFGNIDLPVSFRNSTVSIPDARAELPGGNLAFKGSANIKNTSNPVLDFTASTSGINLETLMNALKLQDKSMPVSGRVKGSAAVKGPLNTAALTANIQADGVKAGDILTVGSANLDAKTDMKMSSLRAKLRADNLKAADIADVPKAVIEADGNMKSINIRNVDVKINGAELKGLGNINPNMNDVMASTMNIDASLKHLDLKKLLKNFMEKPPVEGVIDAKAGLTGTFGQPAVNVVLTKPVLYEKSEINDIAVKVKSPHPNHFLINAKARINNFKPESDIEVRIKDGIVSYVVDTKPLDINSAVETQMPEMAGMARGYAVVHVQGSTRQNAPIIITAKSNGITVMDKVEIKNISLPVTYFTAKNRVEMTNGRAELSGGTIKTSLAADTGTKETEWNGTVNVSNLDFGKLAAPFMPEGELVGSVDLQVNMKGTSTKYMVLSFADGKFTTGPGCIRKMKMLENITPTKQISFEKINGTFFWDGRDLFLNPGTGARAGFDEPLYRYVTVNGSLGVPGKGMRLLCDGRFDLKILDQLLGAMKGVFQYMTGSLGRNVLRDAAGRVLGMKRRDFQNVSFTLANSWKDPRLLDLKITKPIEDFLPIDILNKDEEKQKEDVGFKMSIKLPVGKGAPSAEDESAGDQFKQQLIDNIFKIGM